jgi:hypothetical protein
MDAAFVPTHLAVTHNHKIIIELGPTVVALGRPIRNLLIGAAAIYCMTGLVRGALQAVLKTNLDHDYDHDYDAGEKRKKKSNTAAAPHARNPNSFASLLIHKRED